MRIASGDRSAGEGKRKSSSRAPKPIQYVVDEHGSAQLQRRLSPHQTTAKDDNGNVGGGEGEQLPRATGHQPKVHCSRVTGGGGGDGNYRGAEDENEDDDDDRTTEQL
ncbi:hypothetical protein TYRP_017905 [Tyrophagus putrescentiae]|nr:hypothetical protein TYRP_017905 [Tyrophagus putrescentiae]